MPNSSPPVSSSNVSGSSSQGSSTSGIGSSASSSVGASNGAQTTSAATATGPELISSSATNNSNINTSSTSSNITSADASGAPAGASDELGSKHKKSDVGLNQPGNDIMAGAEYQEGSNETGMVGSNNVNGSSEHASTVNVGGDGGGGRCRRDDMHAGGGGLPNEIDSNCSINGSFVSDQLSRTNLYIKGLAPNTTDKILYELCSPYVSPLLSLFSLIFFKEVFFIADLVCVILSIFSLSSEYSFGTITSTKAILEKETNICKGNIYSLNGF